MSSLIDELAVETAAETRSCKICRWEQSYFGDPGVDRQAEKKAYDDYNGEIIKLHRACSRLDPPLNCAYSTFVRHLRGCR